MGRSTSKPYLPRLTARWADEATGQSVWEKVLGGEELTLTAGRSWWVVKEGSREEG